MKYPINYLAIILLAFAGFACKKKDREGPTLFTGERTRLLRESVYEEGAKIRVDEKGDPLDGMEIEIPSGAFGNRAEFNISYETISSHKLGKYFNPVTPLITIDHGGGYAEEPMILSIPVKVASDEFAMAFFYNTSTGKLEGIPLLDSYGGKVVVVSRRWGSKEENAPARHPAGSQVGLPDDEDTEKIVITAAKRRDLTGDFDTDFRPGTDDFPNENRGSTYAPQGFCAGQSIAMLWYYTNMTQKGERALYRIMDNEGETRSPDFWEDDVTAIRIASVMQKEYTATLPFRAIANFLGTAGQYFLPDNVTLNAFSYAILLTKEPQLVCMNTSSFFEGHAMVVYRVKDRTLYVADPNFPGRKDRRIEYDAEKGKFKPYASSLRSGSASLEFGNIFYVAKSAFHSWPRAGKAWRKVDDKTIGKEEFPGYELVALDENVEFVPFGEGFEVPGNSLTVRVRGIAGTVYLYDEFNKPLHRDGDAVELTPGEHTLGVLVKDGKDNWVDFRRMKVKVKKEKPVITGKKPTYGQVYIEMTVDGVRENIDDTTLFSLSEGSRYFALRGYGPLPKPDDPDYLRHNIHIQVENCDGVGVYTNGTMEWKEDANMNTTGIFKGFNGTVQITGWGPGKMEGNFSFSVTEQHNSYGEPRVRKIEGKFRYKGGFESWMNE